MEAQGVVKNGCRRRIGDGKSTRVWEVPWLPCLTDGYLTTEMPIELKDVTVNNLMDESQQNWDEDVIRDICNERDGNLICKIPLPKISREDTWFWMLEDKGEFTVRSCYRHLQGEQEYAEKFLAKTVVSRFARKAKALHTKHVNINLECAWCQTATEDAVHVLFQCDFAQEIWRSTGLQNTFIVLPQDTVKTMLQKVFDTGGKDQCAMVGLMCWGLWYRRNKWVWDRVNQSGFGLKAMVFNMLSDWKRAKEANVKTTIQQQLGDRIWSKPPTGWLKINVDAACNQSSGAAGVGCIIRDSQGHFLRARCHGLQGVQCSLDNKSRGRVEETCRATDEGKEDRSS